MRKYREYSDEDVIRYAKEVNSMAGLLRKLNLRFAGGNYDNLRRILQELNVDCDHWTGQAWSKDKRKKDWSQFTKTQSIKPHLIKNKGHKCESCGLTEWLGSPIILEVDHKDGDRTNNMFDNLRLLCCNCHSITPTWRNKKRDTQR